MSQFKEKNNVSIMELDEAINVVVIPQDPAEDKINYMSQIDEKINDSIMEVNKTTVILQSNVDVIPQDPAEDQINYMSQFDEKITENIVEVNKETVDIQTNLVVIPQDPSEDNKNEKADEKDNDETPRAFTCHFCGESKNKKSAIMLHYRTKHGVCRNITTNTVYRRRPKCIECKTTKRCVHSKYIIYYQNQRRTKKAWATCRSCPYKCLGKRRLLDHVKWDHLYRYRETCEHCQKKFPTHIAYRYHMHRYHSKIKRCSFCDSREFANKARLLKHQAICENVKREFACNRCPATFDTDKKLRYHKNKHDNFYRCTLCTKVFVSSRQLKAHQRFHILIENDKYPTFINKCSICRLQFDNRNDFRVHVSEDHKPDDKHYCMTCDQEIDTRTEFLEHLSKYSHRVKLNPNIRMVYECDQCEWSSLSATEFESHVNGIHLKIKPYKCASCPKSFTDKEKLRHHSLYHSIAKKCCFCEEYFCSTSRTAYRRHVKRHRAQKYYSCFICKKRFVDSSKVLVHQKRDHYLKTVECPKCLTLFPNPESMKLHFRHVHWEFKDEEFNIDRVQGLTDEQKKIFRSPLPINFVIIDFAVPPLPRRKTNNNTSSNSNN